MHATAAPTGGRWIAPANGRHEQPRGPVAGGVGLLGPEGASREERRLGTGPSFVRMTEGRAARRRRVTGAQTYGFTEELGSTLRTVKGSDGTTASTYRYGVFGELEGRRQGCRRTRCCSPSRGGQAGEQYDAKAREGQEAFNCPPG